MLLIEGVLEDPLTSHSYSSTTDSATATATASTALEPRLYVHVLDEVDATSPVENHGLGFRVKPKLPKP